MANCTIAPIYGLWIKNNIDKYIFVSENAKTLKNEFINCDLKNTGAEQLLIELYSKFIGIFHNNPYSLYYELEFSNINIYTEELDCYLVQNEYGVLLPIRLLKENNKLYIIQKDELLNEAKGKLAEAQSGYYSYKEQCEGRVAVVRHHKFASIPVSIVGMIGFVLCGIILYSVKERIHETELKSVLGVLILSFIFIVIILMAKLILQITRIDNVKSFQKAWANMNAISVDLVNTEKLLDAYSIEHGNEKETEKVSILERLKNVSTNIRMNSLSNINSFLDRPSRLFQSFGKGSVFLLICICLFFLLLKQDKFYNAAKEWNVKQANTDVGKDTDTDSGTDIIEVTATTKPSGEDATTDFKKIKIKEALASSQLKAASGKTYGPDLSCDKDIKTCWQEGTDTDGAGEYLTYKFIEAEIGMVKIANGNQYSEKKYNNNNRIKNAEIKVYYKGKLVVTNQFEFKDSMGITEIKLDYGTDTHVLSDEIRVYIVDTYTGAQYNDTCVSEVEIYKTVY